MIDSVPLFFVGFLCACVCVFFYIGSLVVLDTDLTDHHVLQMAVNTVVPLC